MADVLVVLCEPKKPYVGRDEVHGHCEGPVRLSLARHVSDDVDMDGTKIHLSHFEML